MRALLLIVFAFSVSPALAKGGGCKTDRQTICPGVEPGKGRINNCLFTSWEKVSPLCKEKKKDAYDRWKVRQDACGTDIEKFCKDTDQERPGKCLRKRQTELTASCQEFLKERKAKHKGKMAACEADIAKHCPDLQKGEGRSWKCLVDHQDDLTPGCKSQWPSLEKKAQRKQRKADKEARKAAKKAEREARKAGKKGN